MIYKVRDDSIYKIFKWVSPDQKKKKETRKKQNLPLLVNIFLKTMIKTNAAVLKIMSKAQISEALLTFCLPGRESNLKNPVWPAGKIQQADDREESPSTRREATRESYLWTYFGS